MPDAQSMIERYRRAAMERAASTTDAKFSFQFETPDDSRLFWTGIVRAVLTAMREPTEKMVEAAYAIEPDGKVPSLSDAWSAMIDAALEDGRNE